MFGLLVLAMSVGVLLGGMVTRLARSRATAIALLLASFLLMMLLGGAVVPLPRMSPAFRGAAAASPSRWAFEGVVVLESDARPTRLFSNHDPQAVPIDMAEAYFPAETDRMGPTAAALALVAISIGLAGIIGTPLPVTARH
jgi:hypothetical protein